MKSLYASILALFIWFNISHAQNETKTAQSNPKYSRQQVEIPKQKGQSPLSPDRIFYGGSLGLSFGNVTSVRLNPLIGYRLSPRLSAGFTGLYEYNSYNWNGLRQNYSNYGGSVFSRFKVIPQLYAHAEFSYISYEKIVPGEDRTALPFLFLGGGYLQRIGPNVYAYAQILFDVLQDSNSPYEDWTPFYSVGISVGF